MKSETLTNLNPYDYNTKTSFKDIYTNHKAFYESISDKVNNLKLLNLESLYGSKESTNQSEITNPY